MGVEKIIVVVPNGHGGEKAFAALLVCLGFALFAANGSSPPAEEEVLARAFQEGQAAAIECRIKRLSGELHTHIQSVQCSNGRIIQAFWSVNYRYMDLIGRYTAGRLQIAEKIDRGLITEAQVQTETVILINAINEAARQRDLAQK
jgi:hypothetical protein